MLMLLGPGLRPSHQAVLAFLHAHAHAGELAPILTKYACVKQGACSVERGRSCRSEVVECWLCTCRSAKG